MSKKRRFVESASRVYTDSVRTHLSVIFVVLGLMIGVFFAAQFRTEVPLDSAFPADQYQARQHLIKEFIDEQSGLRSQITALNDQIQEQQKKNETLISKTKLEYLDTLRRIVGLSSISGSGLEVYIGDSPGANRESTGPIAEAVVQASDLRDIVNFLRTGNIKAIAINNQRLLPTSSITAVGANILVHNFYIAPPYVISVVGDEEYLLQRLSDKSVLSDIKKRTSLLKMPFRVSLKPHITLPPYNGDFRVKYLTALP